MIIRGTRQNRLLLVEVPTKDGNPGPIHAVPRISFYFRVRPPLSHRLYEMLQHHGKGFTVIRKQFPIRLAYAQTFNKSQGLTLDRVGVDFIVPLPSSLLP